MNITARNESGGFTLMEILAALVLIGLILPVAMKGVSLATILASESTRKYEAIDLAETKLGEIILTQDWQSGSGSGVFEEGENENIRYEWIMDVSDWTDSTLNLKQVDLTVFWLQRGRQREITLTTLVYNES